MAKKTQDGGLAEVAESGMMRLGKAKHPTLGECVRVKLRHWNGPIYPGQKGRYEYTEHLFPRDQGRWGAPPMLCGYDDDGRRTCTISSGVSYMSDLRKYGSFRMGRPQPVLSAD